MYSFNANEISEKETRELLDYIEEHGLSKEQIDSLVDFAQTQNLNGKQILYKLWEHLCH
jgi:hypothetical protein